MSFEDLAEVDRLRLLVDDLREALRMLRYAGNDSFESIGTLETRLEAARRYEVARRSASAVLSRAYRERRKFAPASELRDGGTQ